MAVLQEYKCPCCDGAISFDAGLQKMKCPYCDTEFEVSTLAAYDTALNEDRDDDMVWESTTPEQLSEGIRAYVCNTCGGEILGDEHTAATACPFCGNPVVMMEKVSGVLKPDLVIPFRRDKKAAIAALKKHYMGKRLLPKVFKDENHLKEIQGIYVPVWLFDAGAQADVRYKGTQVQFWSDSRYNYTKTSYFAVSRSGSLQFTRIPVDGSSKIDNTLMESLEPFDSSKGVDFQTAYLAGYLADKYDADANSCVERANQRIKRSTEEAIADTVSGYNDLIPEHSSIRLTQGKTLYALYPVWILNTKWKGQTYTFAMNGQTGKFVGDLPMDKGIYRKWLFGITAAAAAVAYALGYLIWMI